MRTPIFSTRSDDPQAANLIDRPLVRQMVNAHYPHLADRLRGDIL